MKGTLTFHFGVTLTKVFSSKEYILQQKPNLALIWRAHEREAKLGFHNQNCLCVSHVIYTYALLRPTHWTTCCSSDREQTFLASLIWEEWSLPACLPCLPVLALSACVGDCHKCTKNHTHESTTHIHTRDRTILALSFPPPILHVRTHVRETCYCCGGRQHNLTGARANETKRISRVRARVGDGAGRKAHFSSSSSPQAG